MYFYFSDCYINFIICMERHDQLWKMRIGTLIHLDARVPPLSHSSLPVRSSHAQPSEHIQTITHTGLPKPVCSAFCRRKEKLKHADVIETEGLDTLLHPQHERHISSVKSLSSSLTTNAVEIPQWVMKTIPPRKMDIISIIVKELDMSYNDFQQVGRRVLESVSRSKSHQSAEETAQNPAKRRKKG
eukprot:TRINITY_DN78195_c0_g1_i1.p1 TRINITY_DN78195_c0_g1~~TRINITY_DN78195_c0_g1_i1.p1  ORF type:complete len:186 (-),score=40.67 TRINITY_DN78195_c0_g1_i1:11-568(-)